MSEPVPRGGVLVVDGIRGSRSGPFLLDTKTQVFAEAALGG